MSSAAKKSSSCETFTIYHGKTGPRCCQEQTGGYSEAADVQRYASRKAGRVSSRIPSNILKKSERWSIWHRPHAAGSPPLSGRQQTSMVLASPKSLIRGLHLH